MRLTQKNVTEKQWLENLLMFLGKKPSDKWSDTDQAIAEYRLSEFTRKLNDLEKLRVYYEGNKRKHDEDFDVYLLRSIKKGVTDYEGVVTIDSKRHEVIKEAKSAIQKRISGIGDPELELALLAEKHEKPLYVATEIMKLQTDTIEGCPIHLERRPPDEILDITGGFDFPDRIKVVHQFFDLTPASYIRALITEQGIVSPATIGMAWSKFESMFNGVS